MKRLNQPERCPPSFTLIELVCALSLVSILAGLVMLSLAGHVNSAALNRSVECLREADRQARSLSLKSGSPVKLRFDPGKQQLVLSPSQRRFALPRQVQISLPLQLSPGGWSESGSDVPFYGSGSSSTYCSQLRAGSLSIWVAVFGATGQLVSCSSQQELQEFAQ